MLQDNNNGLSEEAPYLSINGPIHTTMKQDNFQVLFALSVPSETQLSIPVCAVDDTVIKNSSAASAGDEQKALIIPHCPHRTNNMWQPPVECL